MSKKIVGIGISLIILIIVVLFAHSYSQLSVNLEDVKFHSIDLEPISLSTLFNFDLNKLAGNWFDAVFDLINGVNLNLVFGISNNGLFPVYIPDLTYDILINNVSIGKGYSDTDLTINPGQTKEIISFQNIQKSSLTPVVQSIIDSDGIMDIKVSGTAYFKLLGLSIPIPFESSKQVSIYDEIRIKLDFR